MSFEAESNSELTVIVPGYQLHFRLTVQNKIHKQKCLSGHPDWHTWQYCRSLWFSARSVLKRSHPYYKAKTVLERSHPSYKATFSLQKGWLYKRGTTVFERTSKDNSCNVWFHDIPEILIKLVLNINQSM